MFLWISDPVSDVISASDGSCKKLSHCGEYSPCKKGLECNSLTSCGCYSRCKVNLPKHKKKKKKK